MTFANPQRPKKTLLRNLGEFFGHIAHGINKPVAGNSPSRQTDTPPPISPKLAHASPLIRRETHEQQVLTSQGKVILRRTIIDEVRPAADSRVVSAVVMPCRPWPKWANPDRELSPGRAGLSGFKRSERKGGLQAGAHVLR